MGGNGGSAAVVATTIAPQFIAQQLPQQQPVFNQPQPQVQPFNTNAAFQQPQQPFQVKYWKQSLE